MIYLTIGWIVVFTLLTFPREEFTRAEPLGTSTQHGIAMPPFMGWTSGFT